MEDRYSVLIRLESQSDADAFYSASNGKRFKTSEAETCHIYFTRSVEFNDLAEIASTPPPGFMELPTCPICLERLDQDTSGIQSTFCDHSFLCYCISKWTYLSCQVCRFCRQQDDKPCCSVCGTLQNLWICLICGFVGCGRYASGHAIKHWKDTMHHFSLDLETQRIWDYVGDKYVHRLNQTKSDGKSAMTYSRCVSNGGGGSCGYEDDSGLDGALFNSKVDAIVDEYNHLLASQLEIQRQHYEALYTEAKHSKETSVSKAVEKAVFSKMHDLEGQLESMIEERNVIAEKNKELLKNQQRLKQIHKEIEERLSSTLQSKDEKILDLEEQIRDLKIYVEAQKMIANMDDSEDIKGGAVLPAEASRSSQGKTNRRGRQGRKRN